MNTGKTIFLQLMDFLLRHEFQRCVQRYDGDFRVQTFSCWDQFLCMAFAQLTYRESLRDIESCLRSMQSRLYHMGIRSLVARNTLSNANNQRDWHIYADFAQVLMHIARELYLKEPFGIELDQTVYALDATTIDLCLSLFPWAYFRKHKGAIKLHTLLDLRGCIPSFIKITDGKVHDVNILDMLIPEPGSFYVMDRGYLDFARLYLLHQAGAFFVIRAKSNLKCQRLYSRPVDKSTGAAVRSNNCSDGLSVSPRLSRKTSTRTVLRYRAQQTTDVFGQQFSPPRFDHRAIVQIPLEGRTIFQVDQATFENQSVFWNVRERRQNASLDCNIDLRAGSDYQKTFGFEAESLRNSTDFKRYHV